MTDRNRIHFQPCSYFIIVILIEKLFFITEIHFIEFNSADSKFVWVHFYWKKNKCKHILPFFHCFSSIIEFTLLYNKYCKHSKTNNKYFFKYLFFYKFLTFFSPWMRIEWLLLLVLFRRLSRFLFCSSFYYFICLPDINAWFTEWISLKRLLLLLLFRRISKIQIITFNGTDIQIEYIMFY